MAKLQDDMNMLFDAANGAYKQIRNAAGDTNDPDIILYDSIDPDGMMKMTRRHGPENILKYMKTMEDRRIKDAATP